MKAPILLPLALFLLVSTSTVASAVDWRRVGPRRVDYIDVAASPSTGAVIALSSTGITRSTDDGATFESIPLPARGSRLEVVYSADAILWVLTAGDLVRSDDDGQTFVCVRPDVPRGVRMTSLAFDAAQPGRVLVGHDDPGAMTLRRVSESLDYGLTWADKTPSVWDPAVVTRCNAVAIGSSPPGGLAFSTPNAPLAYSSDDGASWSLGRAFSYATETLFVGDRLLVADDDGVWHSGDGGATFASSTHDTPQGSQPFFIWSDHLEVLAEQPLVVGAYVTGLGLGKSYDQGVTFTFPLPLGRNFPMGKYTADSLGRTLCVSPLGLLRDSGPGTQLSLLTADVLFSAEQFLTSTVIDPVSPDRWSSILFSDDTYGESRPLHLLSDDGGNRWEPHFSDQFAASSAAFTGAGLRLLGGVALTDGSGGEAASLLMEDPTGWRPIGPTHQSSVESVDTIAVAGGAVGTGDLVVVQVVTDSSAGDSAHIYSSTDNGLNWTLGTTVAGQAFPHAAALITYGGPHGTRGYASVTSGSASFGTGLRAGTMGATSWTFVEGAGGRTNVPETTLLTSAATPGRVYFAHPDTSSSSASGRLRYSDDGGATWTLIGPPLDREDGIQASQLEAGKLFRLRDRQVWERTIHQSPWTPIPTSGLPTFFSDHFRLLPQDAGVAVTGHGIVVNELRPEVGTAICAPAVPNSAGREGLLTATGTTSAGSFDLALYASDLPSVTFGIFLASPVSMASQVIVGGVGRICIGDPIVRMDDQVLSSGAIGTMRLVVSADDLTSGTGTGPIGPGDTWFFQAWHRDSTPTGAVTSNLTHAVEVVFSQ